MTKISEKFGITYPIPVFILQDPQYKAISRSPKILMLYGYLILRSNADAHTAVRITTKQMIRETSISLNTIDRGMKILEDHGLITRRKLLKGRITFVTTFTGLVETKMKIAN